MDLTDSTYILKNILVSELDQASARNRLWTRKLTCVSYADALLSVKIAKELGHTLSSRPFVLLIPRESVALYTEAQLLKLGIVRLQVPGLFQYYATSSLPTAVLFRKKKEKKAQPTENAAQSIDLRKGWLELLPYEVRFINGKLVIRAAAYLEHLRLATENDILRIGNDEAWKRASKKARASLDYCSITAFDRVIIVGLLRRNFLHLTPKAEYYFHQKDGHVSEATPRFVHPFIFAVSQQNRYRFFPAQKGN
ncbi:hypothetical protein [Candidatus Cryosericum septentrionale]|jgi:hypothetical protein|uniref:Uncharacterized protein n=1 Tax=Candidatus Cryosericum septentrionale TaxID=2290913 RepID=A0A398DMX5_9BACT|nr:hypothetical protein [Candidatus Cryosericum septentrionale]RIE16962.1 hypothetical protein SMC1_03920 [Candidatus Cryosericum septentrionale]